MYVIRHKHTEARLEREIWFCLSDFLLNVGYWMYPKQVLGTRSVEDPSMMFASTYEYQVFYTLYFATTLILGLSLVFSSLSLLLHFWLPTPSRCIQWSIAILITLITIAGIPLTVYFTCKDIKNPTPHYLWGKNMSEFSHINVSLS